LKQSVHYSYFLPVIATPNRGPEVKLVINERCLADELQEALQRGDNDDVFLPEQTHKQEKVYPKFSKQYLDELKNGCFNSVSGNTAPCLSSDNVYLSEDSVPDTRPRLRSRHMSKDARHLSADSGRSLSTDSGTDADVDAPNKTEKVDSRLYSITSQKRIEAKDSKKYLSSKEEVSESSASSAALLTSDDRKRRGSGDGTIISLPL
jgi:hypothetical protein